ncbi:hypothetical protein L6164_029863 [Bauhinia variegata]|uniref:Uncharacterized protein n=1 Tax=Bauhinia variegata TaxID=167791 RepID=A0ACB9LAF3_BAUVA|nr:hypothetical protein L6164_029863 [Bauhinia variegata]
MALISESPFFLRCVVVAITLFVICLFPTVHAEDEFSSVIKLPSKEEQDLCAGTVPVSCPVTCFRTDPVCGVNGVNYWCGCAEAVCAGTKVAKLGVCEMDNGGSASLPGQALLLVHILWLIVLGFSVIFGLF